MAFEKLEVPPAVTNAVLTEVALKAAEVDESVNMLNLLGAAAGINRYEVSAFEKVSSAHRAETYLNERIAGRYNDSAGKRPGIVALVTKTGMEEIEATLARRNCRANYSGITIEETETQATYEPLFVVKMPLGSYIERVPVRMTLLDSVVLHPRGGFLVPTLETVNSPFLLYRRDVITVADDGGAYWQNPSYNLDGSPSGWQPERASRYFFGNQQTN